MRRRAFNLGGSIPKWFASERSYTEGPLFRQGAAPEPGVVTENQAQFNQEELVENRTHGRQTPVEHESRFIHTRRYPSCQELPLSPLMDPAYQAAKQKYKLPKAEPSKEPTPFQQKLAKNPYARALATPVRMCSQTRIQLPSFFLQDFELIAHPSTEEWWYLPRSLTSPYSPSPTMDENFSPETLPLQGSKGGPKAYVLSRASLIQAMATPGSGFEHGEARFQPNNAKQFPAFRAMKTRWRKDMDTFVLQLMRRRIVEGLKYLCGRKLGYLHGCPDWEYAKRGKQLGAFLWLGQEDETTFAAVDDAEQPPNNRGKETAGVQEDEAGFDRGEIAAAGQAHEILIGKEEKKVEESSSSVAPREFATLDLNRKLPVHNLQFLLGETLVRDLRYYMPAIFRHEVVALKHRRTTVDMQLRLWKLQGYLAEHKQMYDE